MLDDNEDVFDSVTWETPSGGGAAYNPPPSGPGFRQSTSDSVEEPRPHDPKWEGYLITSVKDPVKELAETKDAYVSYIVSAKVCLFLRIPQIFDGLTHLRRPISQYSLHQTPRRGDAFRTSFFLEIT